MRTVPTSDLAIVPGERTMAVREAATTLIYMAEYWKFEPVGDIITEFPVCFDNNEPEDF